MQVICVVVTYAVIIVNWQIAVLYCYVYGLVVVVFGDITAPIYLHLKVKISVVGIKDYFFVFTENMLHFCRRINELQRMFGY